MGFFGGRKRERRLEEAGINASAQILSVQDTGMTVNNNPRIKLVLSVTPSDGSAAFEVTKKQLVSRVAVPRAGDALIVRYDPEDHDNFELAAADATGATSQAVDINAVSAGDIASAASAQPDQVQR